MTLGSIERTIGPGYVVRTFVEEDRHVARKARAVSKQHTKYSISREEVFNAKIKGAGQVLISYVRYESLRFGEDDIKWIIE